MIVHRGIPLKTKINSPVLSIGTFDGVHIGHQQILQRLIEKAKEIGGESCLISFDPHPRHVLNKKSTMGLLQTLDEKIEALREVGIDHLILIPFTRSFAEMEAENYIADVLVSNLHPHTIIIGYDHQFGRNRQGNFDLLYKLKSKYHYELEEIPAHEIERSAVSSTQIRSALLDGDIQKTTLLLGRPYRIDGTVIHGDGRGAQIGFPTANIRISDRAKLLPATGVYAVGVIVENILYKGMMNIGTRPTFYHEGSTSIEVHLLDTKIDLYGKNLQCIFTSKLRDEKKFASIEELKSQLEIDQQQTRLYCHDNFIFKT